MATIAIEATTHILLLAVRRLDTITPTDAAPNHPLVLLVVTTRSNALRRPEQDTIRRATLFAANLDMTIHGKDHRATLDAHNSQDGRLRDAGEL